MALRAALVAPYAAPPSRPIWPAMLDRLMMLPEDRSAIPGAIAGDEEVRGAHVAVEEIVERCLVQIRRRPEPRSPGVVDQDVHGSDLFDQASHRRYVLQIGCHEPRPAPLPLDLPDHFGPSLGVPAVHDDVPAVAGQPQGGRPAYAGGRPGDDGPARRCPSRWPFCAHDAPPDE